MSASSRTTASEQPVSEKLIFRWMWRIAIGSIFAFSALTIIAHTPLGAQMVGMLSEAPRDPVGLDDGDGAARQAQHDAALLPQNVAASRVERDEFDR